MNRMLDRMRALSIKELKSRREEIFERTRSIMQNDTYDESALEEEDSCMPEPQLLEPIMDEKEEKVHRRKQKELNAQHRVQRYYRKMMQVSDWMVDVPQLLHQFYLAPRPDGNKCLVVFENYSLAIRDKSGREVFETEIGSKAYSGTLVEAYYNESTRCLVVSDLIVWKTNPMTSSEFEFRQAWLCSNLNLTKLKPQTPLSVHFMPYSPATLQNLGKHYQQPCTYPKQGLLFVHKDSFYLHGLNHNVLIWKDHTISKYFQQQIEDNKQHSKGIAFLNKLGEVKTLQNVVLTHVDRRLLDSSHRFLKFSFSSMHIQNTTEEEQVSVNLQTFQILETVRYHNGPVDSLSKLLYKSSIKKGIVTIQELAQRLQNPVQNEMKQQ